VEDLAAGQGHAVLVEGEPGIGKSALLRAAWERSAEAGRLAFWGAGEELGQCFPLLPLLDAFAVRESSPDPRRVEVRRLLRGVGGEHPVAAAAERLLDLVDDACADTPAVLVVDDLHWADAATVALWHRLARTAAQRPLLLLGAMRPLPRRDGLQVLRRAVGADHLLQLGPLPAAVVTGLVATLAGAAPGPELARLAEGAAGNPLYLTELVDALDRGDRLAISGGIAEATPGPAPRTLTEAIIDRLDFLPTPARETLQAAALLGGEFTVEELSLILGRSPADLGPALAQARTAGVLAEAGGRLAFRHPLIRAALYDNTAAAVRVAWHREAAHALRQAGAPVGHIARQLLPTMDDPRLDTAADWHADGRADWVADWLIEAAPLLVNEAAHAAVQLLTPAVRHLLASDRRQHWLASHLARALAFQAENDAAEQLISRTLQHVSDPEVLVNLYDALARIRTAPRSRVSEALASIEQTLTTCPTLTATARNRLELTTARLHNIRGDSHEAERIARGALATATQTGDRWALAGAAAMLGVILGWRGDLRASLDMTGQGLAATQGQADLADLRIFLLVQQAEAHKHLDRLDEARATFAEAGRLADRSGDRRQLVSAQASLCEAHFLAGCWDDALTESTLPEDVDATIDQCLVHGVAAVVSCHRGDIKAARQHLAAGQRFAERIPHELTGPWTLAGARIQETAHDPAAALRVLRDRLAYRADIETELWLADAVRLAVDVGDQEFAQEVTAQAEAIAADGLVPHRTAAALHCRGLVTAAPHLLLEAANGYQQASWPLSQAQALEAAAGVLADRGDTAAARAPFTAAFGIYTALGADWDITRVRSRFRRHGLHGPRPRRRAATGWAALTTTEAKVAALVAEGQTNREIADTLVMSRHTVGTHVARILAKLQAHSRFEVIRAAATATPVAD
jgi:DNA-binding CsgD family transcriptional regulator/tetratricopeptide (TPR) repeat protein